ncbi:MAG: hypothetical protein AAF253_10030, partial [Pseudomonadota bacterium]
DMLMLFVTPDGGFPTGFAPVTLTEADISHPTERGPVVTLGSGEPIVTASLPSPDETDPDARILVTTPTEQQLNPQDSVREVSAPESLAVAAVVVAPAAGAATGDDPAAEPEDDTAPVPEEQIPPTNVSEPEPEEPIEIVETAASPETATRTLPFAQEIAAPAGIASGRYSYNCTYICQATMVDESLKFPVTRRIADVSESNAELFSLDAMALDSGVCLAEGGKLPEGARLPPVCERLN